MSSISVFIDVLEMCKKKKKKKKKKKEINRYPLLLLSMKKKPHLSHLESTMYHQDFDHPLPFI